MTLYIIYERDLSAKVIIARSRQEAYEIYVGEKYLPDVTPFHELNIVEKAITKPGLYATVDDLGCLELTL